MNDYNNILDSWITIEQLSEGSINKKDQTYRQLCDNQNDWKQFFEEYIQTQKVANRMSAKSFKKSGIVMYFGIFDFQEVLDILRKQYGIASTDEEM